MRDTHSVAQQQQQTTVVQIFSVFRSHVCPILFDTSGYFCWTSSHLSSVAHLHMSQHTYSTGWTQTTRWMTDADSSKWQTVLHTAMHTLMCLIMDAPPPFLSLLFVRIQEMRRILSKNVHAFVCVCLSSGVCARGQPKTDYSEYLSSASTFIILADKRTRC